MGEKTGVYTVGVDWSAGVDWTVVEGIGADGRRLVFPLVCICENRDAEMNGYCCECRAKIMYVWDDDAP